MTTFITVFFGGVISALVMLFVGQPLQHHFWRRQQQAERQLAIIDEVKPLAAEFLYHYMEDYDKDPRLNLSPTFFQAFDAAGSQVQVLSSASAFQAFKQMAGLIGAWRIGEQQQQRIEEFIQAREVAFRALYHDMDLPTPPLWHRIRTGVRDILQQPWGQRSRKDRP